MEPWKWGQQLSLWTLLQWLNQWGNFQVVKHGRPPPPSRPQRHSKNVANPERRAPPLIWTGIPALCMVLLSSVLEFGLQAS